MTTHESRVITCPECKGQGDDPEQSWRKCGWCRGVGVVHVNRPNAPALREPQDEPPGRDLGET